jgi:5'-nucleotidase (lipoprotein e(P4) family)
MKKYIAILLLTGLAACNCSKEKPKIVKQNISDNALAMATIYSYYADEYRALTYQAFNIAKERVNNIRSDHPYAENLAIVVDIDETMIDNSPFEALMIAKDTNYPYMWNEWCDLEKAKAIPGAVEFMQYADSQGFQLYYVSNRKDEYVHESTMKNMLALGFPQVEEDHFMLRLARSENNPNPSDKQMRRDNITAAGNEIVMLIGDNLGDFYTDEKEHKARVAQVEEFKNEFGERFIVLPNAMYGNWAASLGIKDKASMDSLLIIMTEAFN